MPARIKPSRYEQLCALPEGLIGEMYTQPQPAGPHALAAAALGGELYGPFHRGSSGPGGWWILPEPELHFLRDVEVDVPDRAGWRRERMPQIPRGHRFEIVPDWVCEILSSSTEGKDRDIKMPIYAKFGVPSLRVESARVLYAQPGLRSAWTCSSMGSRAAAAGGLRR